MDHTKDKPKNITELGMANLPINRSTQITCESSQMSNQPSSQYSKPASSNISKTRAIKVWSRMAQIYGSIWVTMNGRTPSDEWAKFFNGLDNKQLERAFLICRERLSREVKFPPVLGELVGLINSRTMAEVDQAFARWLAKSPLGKAEKWVYQNCTWNLKRVRAGQEQKEYAKYLKQADELENAGKLQLQEDELLALPINSAVSFADQKREEFARSGKPNPFKDRINKLISEKRNDS